MAGPPDRFDPAPILRTLKDFQRKTVVHAFRRLYERQYASGRFLVADEVGLGKTLVARGIIAKAIARLQDDASIDRIDVVYVCSNAAIAKQNINRLNVTGEQEFSVATRLTLLPLELAQLGKRKLNFVSFTPGTTFDLKYSTGMWKERWLLYHVLRKLPGLHRSGLMHMLRCDVGREGWRLRLKETPEYDKRLIRKFISSVRGDEDLFLELKSIATKFRSDPSTIPPGLRKRRNVMIGNLRRFLAKACVEALEPDLIILDEFQRFRSLLTRDSEAGDLAQELMTYPGVRVLLLSATPYKLLTLYDEEENHYEDFLRTLNFLFAENKSKIDQIKTDLEAYRFALYQDHSNCEEVRDRLQTRLLKVMARTERVRITRERDAMVHEPGVTTSVSVQDLLTANALDNLVRAIGSQEVLEYWKSAPYLLNFMKGYAFKERLDAQISSGNDLKEPLQQIAPYLLTRQQFEGYGAIDPANARMRALIDKTLARDEWKMLWLPASLPYVEHSGGDGSNPLTKSLIFSSWNVVPDVIAAVCSYTAERKRVLSRGNNVNYSNLYKSREALLEFSRSDGRPKAMSSLLLVYPSPTLARLVDPMKMAIEHGKPLSVEEMFAFALERINEFSRQLPRPSHLESEREDKAWYWAAMAKFDTGRYESVKNWVESEEGWPSLLSNEKSESTSGFDDHLVFFLEAASGEVNLGRKPEDFNDVLSEIVLGSPAICASRSLRRVAPELQRHSPELMNAAAQIAEGFRSLFNSPDVRSMVESEDVPYWRQVFKYCAQNDLQSVLDEYVHSLKESLGLIDAPAQVVVTEIASAIRSVLSIRVSALDMDELDRDAEDGKSKFKIRCRYALRFADIKGESEQVLYRAGVVRDAFNSPFRPFILASTSIGQEGLDFHSYCHRIWHWNLPHNPVDLEQREGRVNRYKGHAIRKNVARFVGLEGLRDGWRGHDPWEGLFWLAKKDLREKGKFETEITPYWIYEEVEDPYRVERLVPLPPFSSEHARFRTLKKSLAVYRLALGQPRQEDLVSYLAENSDEKALEAIMNLQIDLSPR